MGEWRKYDKRFMHEPSIRVPMPIRYPRMIRAGATVQEMTTNLDIAPTFLELAGLPVPSRMQGLSMVPFSKARSRGPGANRVSFTTFTATPASPRWPPICAAASKNSARKPATPTSTSRRVSGAGCQPAAGC